MNALLALLAWLLGIFSPTQTSLDHMPGAGVSTEESFDARDIHIVSTNPRTVVALEDTHFSPSR